MNCSLKSLFGLTLVASATVLSTPSNAVDFSCREASNAAERTICRDGQLGRLDDQMAVVYGRLWSVADHRDRLRLRTAQHQFLGARNACGWDAKCIRGAYLDQLSVLDSKLTEALGN